ncbi:MAG: FtsQ-type protein [Solirubrobacterales bacterium]|nr:FtsQ-type protein [Solirubrobacterales bacterium]
MPRLRPRVLAALILALAVVGGGWWWLRDSPLVAVQEVRITGLSSPQTAAIRSALTGAAQDMTTLHVREELLRSAVARYPVVADVRATGDFPHLLQIRIVEHVPVAALQVGDRTISVAGDGTLLRGVPATRVPTIALQAPPAGSHLRDPLALAQVRILAAAPKALRERVTRMFTGARGMQAQLRDGPAIAFGAPDRLAAKWAALTAVLADPSSAGATLIDLTVPESPAAAGLEPVSTTEATTTGPSGATGPAGTADGTPTADPVAPVTTSSSSTPPTMP